MADKRTRKPEQPYESPNWYAAKETAKEMWNSQDFVPAKHALLKKLRDAGLPEMGSNAIDALLPNNPTQAAADLVGLGAVGKGVKALRTIRAARAADKALRKPEEQRWWEAEEDTAEYGAEEPEHMTPEEQETWDKDWERVFQNTTRTRKGP